MSGRYSGWRRLSGDTAERPDLTNEGKKLLAYLDNQRRLSGVKTIEKTITTEDGSIVSAGFDYDIPWIRVFAGTPKKQKRVIARTIEGFIVRPFEGTDNWLNTEKDHVLLTPVDGNFNAAFYDDAHRPAGYASRPLYEQWLPDGLGRYGNVDWQNADASVVLSWMGPSGRYFGDCPRTYGAPWVFLHGKVLFDFTADGARDAIEAATPAPSFDLGVRGACLRLHGRTSWLYVAARDEDQGEYLVRFRLQSPEMQLLMRGGGLDAPAHFFADVEVDYSSGELLLATTVNRFNDGVHPFCFNAEGTEARRMYEGDNTMWELRYVESDEGAWIRSEIEHGPLTSTELEVGEREMGGSVGTWNGAFYTTYDADSGGGADIQEASRSASYGYPWISEYPSGFVEPVANPPVNADDIVSDYSIVTSSNLSYTRTPSQARVKFAVDWKEGVWVYAELYLIAETKTSEMTASPAFSGDLKRVGPGSQDGVTIGETLGHDYFTATYAVSVTEARVRTTKGVFTDFIDIVCGTSQTNAISASVAYTENDDWDATVPGIGMTPDVTTEFSSTRDFSQSLAQTETDLQVFFLDLRHDTIYYQTSTTVTTQTAEAAESDAATQNPGDPDPGIGLDLSFDRVTTTQTTWDAYTIVRGETLQHLTQVDDADVTTLPSSLSWGDGTGLGLIFQFDNSGASAAPTGIGFVHDAQFIVDLGVTYPKPDAELNAWHRFRGATSGSDPEDYSDGATTPDNWFPPEQGALDITRDFFDDLTDGSGSWCVVRDDYVVSQQQPLNRNGEPQFAHFGSQAGLVPLLEAYPGAERLYPVGYCSRVIVARLLSE